MLTGTPKNNAKPDRKGYWHDSFSWEVHFIHGSEVCYRYKENISLSLVILPWNSLGASFDLLDVSKDILLPKERLHNFIFTVVKVLLWGALV